MEQNNGEKFNDRYQRMFEKAELTFWGHLGCQLDHYDEQSVTIKLDVQPYHLNLLGIIHGGVLLSLLDQAMGLHVMLAMKENVVTTYMNTHFLSNTTGGIIFCKTELLHATKRTITLTATIVDEHKKLLATSSGSYRLIKP